MPSLGSVNLVEQDWKKPYNQMITARARSVAQYIDDKNKFDIISQFILNNVYLRDFNANYKDWVDEVNRLNKTLKMSNIDLLTKSVGNAYKTCRNQDEISDFRGRLFEVILEQRYNNKYQDTRHRRSIFDKGCIVTIDNKKIIHVDNESGKAKETVDIAGYNLLESEFYEAKVGPKNFDKLVINYLKILNDFARERKISKSITVGCITMETKASLKQNLKKIKIEHNIDSENLILMGRQEIKSIIY